MHDEVRLKINKDMKKFVLEFVLSTPETEIDEIKINMLAIMTQLISCFTQSLLEYSKKKECITQQDILEMQGQALRICIIDIEKAKTFCEKGATYQ
jgi:hypothetical protein